ncbi:hypothetical protein [Streptomyces filamentosus]
MNWVQCTLVVMTVISPGSAPSHYGCALRMAAARRAALSIALPSKLPRKLPITNDVAPVDMA